MKIDSTNTALHTNAVKSVNNTDRTNSAQVIDQKGPRMVSGPELVDYFADKFAFPSWSDKGLSLSQESKEVIFQALQDSLREAYSKTHGAGGFGTTLNIHQIVMDNQEVPDWFAQEKQVIDQSYGSESFPNGEYYSIDYKGLGPKSYENMAYLGFNENINLTRHLFEIGGVKAKV
ncbi:hypothetical protein [Oceanospirillum beijerinckii]|uniref:hypothetical protein n=1 Tax=Oceanospirillum beijerinckii TaxID=64976 RepID=UPI000480CA6C|nr:hypothetical protein [Oceanospirillum beijerinckii]